MDKLSRKTYEEALTGLTKRLNELTRPGDRLNDHPIKEALDEVLANIGQEVEPEPVTPGISEREWKAEFGTHDKLWHIYAGGYGIAILESNMPADSSQSKKETEEANAKLMAASKKVVEEVARYLRICFTYAELSENDVGNAQDMLDAVREAGAKIER